MDQLDGWLNQTVELLKQAEREFAPDLVFACSFGAEDVVLFDLISRHAPSIRIITLDTGRLPQETYDVMDACREKYGLNIEVYFPDTSDVEQMVREKGVNLFYHSLENRKLCCEINLNIQTPPEGLTESGWRSIIVFSLCLILWVTQLLPLSVTSLLGLALLPLLGVLPADDAYGMFGNSAVFFILGAFMLAGGIIKTGLSEHVALALIDRVGLGPRRLLLTMLLLPALMAAFMPEHAVAAVMLPIVWEIVRGLDLKPGHRYAQSLFFAMAWGAIIGGVATLLGGARGPLALGIVEELTGRGFSFLDWALAAAPL